MDFSGCMWLLLMLVSLSSPSTAEEVIDSIVMRGSTAHLWCDFEATRASHQIPPNAGRKMMIHSPDFRPSVNHPHATPIWSAAEGADSENRRLRVRYNASHLSVNITRVQFQDAGTYTCVGEDSTVGTKHNLIVIGGSITLEKSFEAYDTEQHDGRYYLVPRDIRVVLICSMELSQTPWGSQHPTLKINGAMPFSRRRYGHSLTHTYVVNATKSKEYTCSAIFPDSDWSPLRPSSIFIVVNDNESRAGVQRRVIKYAANHGESLVLSCVSRFDSNNNWKWHRERDLDSQDIVIPMVDCVMTRRDGCANLSSSSSSHVHDLSTRSFSVLKFPSLDYISSGKYSCVDSLMTTQRLFEIIVLDSSPPTVQIDGRIVSQNSTQVFRRNQWVFISCTLRHFINSSLNALVKLTVPNASLHNTSSDGQTFTFKVLMTASRPFNCRVDLPPGYQFYGERIDFTFFAKVLHCPDGITITGNLSQTSIDRGGILNCVVSAEPPVNVTWESRLPLSSVFHFIRGPNFASLMVQNRDVYRCRTEETTHHILGRCSVQYATIRIDQGYLIAELLTVSRSKFVKIGVVRGKSMTMKCTSHHLQNTNWKWFLNLDLSSSSLNLPLVDCPLHEALECLNFSNFRSITDNSNPVLTRLTFTKVEQIHSGNYTCVDSLRTVEKTYELQVFECPDVMTISKLNWEKPYGRGKELMCSVLADPPMNVTWSFRNQSQISISGWNSARMPVFQSGIYECTVDVNHQRMLGSCGSLFSRVRVEDNNEHEHHEIEERR